MSWTCSKHVFSRQKYRKYYPLAYLYERLYGLVKKINDNERDTRTKKNHSRIKTYREDKAHEKKPDLLETCSWASRQASKWLESNPVCLSWCRLFLITLFAFVYQFVEERRTPHYGQSSWTCWLESKFLIWTVSIVFFVCWLCFVSRFISIHNPSKYDLIMQSSHKFSVQLIRKHKGVSMSYKYIKASDGHHGPT